MEPKKDIKGVKGIAELMRSMRGFTAAFMRLKAKCPRCQSEQIQLLTQVGWVKAEDIEMAVPPEYARCKCRICKYRFLVEVTK